MPTLLTMSNDLASWRRLCLLLTLQLGSQTLCKLLGADHDDQRRHFRRWSKDGDFGEMKNTETRSKRRRIGRYESGMRLINCTVQVPFSGSMPSFSPTTMVACRYIRQALCRWCCRGDSLLDVIKLFAIATFTVMLLLRNGASESDLMEIATLRTVVSAAADTNWCKKHL